MRVTVEAYGELRRYLLAGQPQREVELTDGATLADLARALDAEPDDLPLARRGDAIIRDEAPLHDGDHIELFAPVGGG